LGAEQVCRNELVLKKRFKALRLRAPEPKSEKDRTAKMVSYPSHHKFLGIQVATSQVYRKTKKGWGEKTEGDQKGTDRFLRLSHTLSAEASRSPSIGFQGTWERGERRGHRKKRQSNRIRRAQGNLNLTKQEGVRRGMRGRREKQVKKKKRL